MQKLTVQQDWLKGRPPIVVWLPVRKAQNHFKGLANGQERVRELAESLRDEFLRQWRPPLPRGLVDMAPPETRARSPSGLRAFADWFIWQKIYFEDREVTPKEQVLASCQAVILYLAANDSEVQGLVRQFELGGRTTAAGAIYEIAYLVSYLETHQKEKELDAALAFISKTSLHGKRLARARYARQDSVKATVLSLSKDYPFPYRAAGAIAPLVAKRAVACGWVKKETNVERAIYDFLRRELKRLKS